MMQTAQVPSSPLKQTTVVTLSSFDIERVCRAFLHLIQSQKELCNEQKTKAKKSI